MTAARESCPGPQRIHINFACAKPLGVGGGGEHQILTISKVFFYLKSPHIFRISSQVQKERKLEGKNQTNKNNNKLQRKYLKIFVQFFFLYITYVSKHKIISGSDTTGIDPGHECSHDTRANLCILTYSPVSEGHNTEKQSPECDENLSNFTISLKCCGPAARQHSYAGSFSQHPKLTSWNSLLSAKLVSLSKCRSLGFGFFFFFLVGDLPLIIEMEQCIFDFF